MAAKIQLNHAGIRALLKSGQMKALVDEVAEKVAANVRSQGITVGDRDGGKHEYALPVKVESSTTDRAHASVVITHPAGAAVQAKHGVLTKAASATGVSVKGGS